MRHLLLLVDQDGIATTAPLAIRQLREHPGQDGVSVHFRPVRGDMLFQSAKLAGGLAYKILAGEGIVRRQLWVEYEVLGPHVNVTGRSSDLLFALTLITAKWHKEGGYPSIGATGMLDTDSATLSVDSAAGVQGVKHTVSKVAAAVRALANEREAVIFYPAADAEGVASGIAQSELPPQVRLHAVASLEEALTVLGITLEKVYLGNPFRGLEHFDYAHRAIFFGRDGEVRDVLGQLLRRESAGVPGILVEGASGSGKSSFLRAGVLPALINPAAQPGKVEEALRLRPVRQTASRAIWRVGLLPAGADEPRIAQSIRDCWHALPELSGRLNETSRSLADLAIQRREYWPSGQRFVWVLDQFEELFTLELAPSVIDAFGQLLIDLQSGGVWTLASIRADAVPRLKQHAKLRQVFGANEGQYYLESMSATALDDVIDRPAKVAGIRFGMAPSGKLLDQVLREDAYRDRENALPLLQFTLDELYKRRSGTQLTYDAYSQLGGLSGSIATAAAAVLAAESAESQLTMPHLFRSLVSVDGTGRATRRYAPLSEIGTEPVRQRVLARLVDARLCVTDERDGQAVVALAHEALLRTWPTLVEWLKQEAGLLQSRELAQHETRLWLEHGKSADWLAAADKLAAFERLKAAVIALPESVRDFLECSTRRVRRTQRLKRAAVGLIASLAVIASAAGWIATRRQHEAEFETRQALQAQARLLTEAAAQRLKDNDVAGAQAIILEVLTKPEFAPGYTPAAINVFQESRAADAQLAVLSGHGDKVRTAAYSPDGTRIITASVDETARVWNARTGAQVAVLAGGGYAVYSAAYSPDGSRIVTASFDKTARIWDALTGAQLAVLTGHGDIVRTAAYSPDGTRIVTASLDGTARIWDAQTGAQLTVLAGHADRVYSAEYSPDNTRIVTASWDRTARIWDARTGKQLAVLAGHVERLYCAEYSPDGMSIVTASLDKTARVWDAFTGKQLAVLSGHGDTVFSAAYSPDGTRIVTGSLDKTARIWDARTGAPLAVLSGHRDAIYSVAYSPDGTRIVTASTDKTARIWDARPGAQLIVLSGHGDFVGSAAYSPDSARIVTASWDKTARIWEVHTGAQLAALSGHHDLVHWAAYSPDGRHIVTASDDKTARIWDALTGAQLAVLSGHGNSVFYAAYSVDGSRVVTGSWDKTARIWDASTGAQLVVLSGHADIVGFAAYSPDGTRIVTASRDKTVRIWDARTGAQLTVLSGHGGQVGSAVYSPDGTRIVTASDDKTARIWDARSGAQLEVLSGHGDVVDMAAYSPDGTRIVTASNDRTARIWDARTGMQLAVFVGHRGPVSTAAYSPDGDRIVTASNDKTARIWDARVPGDIASQILWDAAAQTDPPSEVDRTRLGLTPDTRVRRWPAHESACDDAAAAFYDPDRRAPGVAQPTIVPEVANSTCSAEIAKAGSATRLLYLSGRALRAKADVMGARQLFERAVSEGYRAARVDLADLLLEDTLGDNDLDRVISLYERAWKDGVTIAAFKLGNLYEAGVSGSRTTAQARLPPDLAKAWAWYTQAMNAGEPDALARFAERDERDAAMETDSKHRDALLLQAFSRYAAAAERAHDEAWPEDAWKHWRYRRATLARLLAREGLMQQVAAAYDAVRKHYEPTPAAWQRLESLVGVRD
jgi:WD40 repeat protein